MFEQRCCNVVGKIADEMKRVPASRTRSTSSASPSMTSTLAGMEVRKLRNQVAIDFNRDDATCSGGQFARERARARSDFNNSVFGLICGEADDPLKDMAVGKESVGRSVSSKNVPYGIRTRAAALKGLCPRPG